MTDMTNEQLTEYKRKEAAAALKIEIDPALAEKMGLVEEIPPKPLNPLIGKISAFMVRKTLFGSRMQATMRQRLLMYSSFTALMTGA